MLYFLISILGMILTISFVIGTHETAHFLAARVLGVKVLRFSIGFGKTLYRWYDKSGTEYVLALFPLGGYVRMLDENEGTVPRSERHLAFNRQPFYKKFTIVLAGPLTNIFCAFLLYWLIFVIGFNTIKPIIGNVKPRSIAAESGLKTNQEILRVDNKNTTSWTPVIYRFIAHLGNLDHMKVDVQNIYDKKTETHLLDISNWHLDGLTPDPLGSLGITPYEPVVPLIVGSIAKNSAAAVSPLKIGDKLIALNKIPVKNWTDVILIVSNHPDADVPFTVQRNGKTLTFPVHISHQQNIFLQKSGYLGMGPNFQMPPILIQHIKYGALESIKHAWDEISNFTYFNLLLFGKIMTGKLSLQSLGGPITIFESAGQSLNNGLLPFISFLAFLSIAVGILNLLPIPGLDGGHLFIQIIEVIIRRPVPEAILLFLYRVGFFLLIFILIQALVNDVLRLY